VVEAIGRALEPLCTELVTPSSPDLVHLHNITHLGTSMTGTLSAGPDGSVPTALQLLAALHPTPAVGGVPAREARSVIADLEPRSRGNYAGPVGYVDAHGNGKWMLGIRSMSVNGRMAHLAAGVGIVEGSSPDVELAETNLKLTAVFDALAPGVPFSTAGTPVTGTVPAGDAAPPGAPRRQAVS
jgi:isochorismate synthase EntC